MSRPKIGDLIPLEVVGEAHHAITRNFTRLDLERRSIRKDELQRMEVEDLATVLARYVFTRSEAETLPCTFLINITEEVNGEGWCLHGSAQKVRTPKTSQ